VPDSWTSAPPEAHNAVPTKPTGSVNPAWDALLDELATGNPVVVTYQELAERGQLARALGRYAAHRGFTIEVRDGDGYISVQRAKERQGAKRRTSR